MEFLFNNNKLSLSLFLLVDVDKFMLLLFNDDIDAWFGYI